MTTRLAPPIPGLPGAHRRLPAASFELEAGAAYRAAQRDGAQDQFDFDLREPSQQARLRPTPSAAAKMAALGDAFAKAADVT